MPRNNKVTERVFADIAGSQTQKEAYKKFLELDKELGLEESDILSLMKSTYADLLDESREAIATLARVEEIIIQIRAKEVVDSELRLSLSRNYIYARSLFYRRGNQINDIRVIVGKTSDFGDNIDELLMDEEFRTLCINKLHEAMDKEIDKNVNFLTKLITV